MIVYEDEVWMIKYPKTSRDLESYSGTGSETLLDEVLATFAGQDDLKSIADGTERFWNMFVIDAFIGNNDRNNGNWGILIEQANGKIELAPVFDEFIFNKRSIEQMEKRMNGVEAKYMIEDVVRAPICIFKYTGLDNDSNKINPFSYIAKQENEDCNAAVARFRNAIDMNRVESMIESIPETTGNLSVMPKMQKAFYLKL